MMIIFIMIMDEFHQDGVRYLIHLNYDTSKMEKLPVTVSMSRERHLSQTLYNWQAEVTRSCKYYACK